MIRDLIKEVLKSYNVEIVSIRKIKKNLHEGKIKDENCHPLSAKELTPEIKNEIELYVRGKSPVTGYFVDRQGKKHEYSFTIKPTFHWKCQLFRKSNPKYKNDLKIENPNMKAAIDLIYNNANKIAKYIQTNQIKPYEDVEVVATDGTRLHMAVDFEPESIGNDYKLVLITLIKGVPLYGYRNQKKLPLP